MFSSLVIVFTLVTGSAAPASQFEPNATDIIAAQAAGASDQLATPETLAKSTNQAARDVELAQKALSTLQGERSSLRETYNTQLAEIDKLSRQRASWSRDRQLSKKKSASASLAKDLAALDKKLRTAGRSLTTKRRDLLRAVESELGGAVAKKRGAELRKLKVALGEILRPKARKIVLPDETVDRLADPEELDEQIALIARAERQLEDEDEKLEERYRYYSKQEKLRAQSERATEVASRDDESIRRSPGIGSADNRGGAEADSSAPNGDGDGDSEGGDGFNEPGEDSSRDFTLESSSVILADVVDEVTAADLRRAGRSARPGTRAKAAERARDQLKQKLERLKKQRELIAKRAKELRSR